MFSKAVLPIGVAVAGVLSLLVLLGVAQQQWVLAAAAGCVLLSACLLVSLDAWRRARSLRGFVRDEIASLAVRQAKAARVVPVAEPTVAQAAPGAEPPDPAPTMAPADVVGTVRLLQAQYVGRLDRLTASVEALVEHTLSRDQRSTDGAATLAEPTLAEPTPADPTPAERATDSAR